MKLRKCLLTKNRCYKAAKKIKPEGIVVHSTGVNNPNLKRYVGPDDGLLGKNTFGNHWNNSIVGKCVHGFIGKDKNKDVQVYQTLPFDYAAWGIGKGKKGSYNYDPGYIQFEICEDNLKDEKYFNEAFGLAIEFCAYLCEKYKIKVENVISHHEGYLRGYGSNHKDCDHWLKKFGKDMDWFRSEVTKKLNKTTTQETKKESSTVKGKKVNYKVKINVKSLNVRDYPGTSKTTKVNGKNKTVTTKITTTVKKNEVFTIVEECNGWGKLKSGAGWISLNCTKRVK